MEARPDSCMDTHALSVHITLTCQPVCRPHSHSEPGPAVKPLIDVMVGPENTKHDDELLYDAATLIHDLSVTVVDQCPASGTCVEPILQVLQPSKAP